MKSKKQDENKTPEVTAQEPSRSTAVRRSLTFTQKWIVDYLNGKDWTSPTDIGNAYANGYHSAWASPKCLKLVEMGLIVKNEKGWYRLVN